MLIFKNTKGGWFKFNDSGKWSLSNEPDFANAEENVFEFVNEIMEDCLVPFQDIYGIVYDEYIPEIGFINNKQILLNL